MNIFFFFQVPVHCNINETLEEAIERNRKKQYYYDDNNSVCGCSTYNIGIANAILKIISEDKFDKIIYAFDNFTRDSYNCNDVNEIVEPDLLKICKGNIITIPINKVKNNPEKIIEKICENVSDLFNGNTIYVSANSGNRNNMMSFLTFAEAMSSQNSKTRAFYTEEEDNKEIVSEITLNKDYFNYLRAVEIFTETGNPSKLRNIFIDNNDSDIEKLFIKMEEFHTSVQLCNTSRENGVLVKYAELIEQIENIEKKFKDSYFEKNTSIEETFKLILPVIKSNFSRKRKKGKELIQIIKWCIHTNNIALGYFILDDELIYYLQGKNIINYDVSISHKDLDKKIDKCVQKIICYSYNKSPSDIIRDYGFNASDLKQLENSIYILNLTKRIRKSLAHSSDTDLLYSNDCLVTIIDEYEENIKSEEISLYTYKDKQKGDYQIKTSDDNYYEIIKTLLVCMIDEIDKFK